MPIIDAVLIRIHEALELAVAMRQKPAANRNANTAENQQFVSNDKGRKDH